MPDPAQPGWLSPRVGLFIWVLVRSGEEMGFSSLPPTPPKSLHPHGGDETTALSLPKGEPSGIPDGGCRDRAEGGCPRHGEPRGFQGTVGFFFGGGEGWELPLEHRGKTAAFG